MEHLENVENILNQYKELSECFKSGFWELAQSKYILGPQRVSSLQYDLKNELEPNFTIQINDDQQFTLKESQKKDCIIWFSALPPKSLRETQKQFQKILSILLQLAQEKRKLQSVLKMSK